ncbi:MAG: Serine/threonine-protein kinase Chk1, partial [Marteilia pararefringens]
VKLALNKNTKEAMAVKFIQNCKDNEDDIKKEIAVHKIVKHENIVKYFAHRSDNGSYFIFLEYICGGELFDYIKPNCGMNIQKANVYFHQLIKALV